MGTWKKFVWAQRQWVGRQYEPFLGLSEKSTEKRIPAANG